MIDSKKIAVLCNYQLLPERVGGMDYFFWLFDQKCKENNIQVDWFFPNQSRHGAYSNLTVFASNGESLENYFLDFCQRNKTEYTHVITHFVELCTPFFYKIKQNSKAKIITVNHNPRPLKEYPFKKKMEKRIKGALFSRYIDLFVGVSKYSVDEIINDFGRHLVKKSKTIYNGVILENIQVRNHRNKTKPTFLVASHLRESKGIQDLIEAVSLLPDVIKASIEIDVYGEGPYKSNLLIQVNHYQLAHCFNFKGSSDNLKELFSNYDYMIQPTHMECFSLSILESLAANVPVITTNVGGNEEVVIDELNGYIFKPKDINAIKNLIEEIYNGNKNIKINTREAIRLNFSLDKMVENHLELLL